MTDALDELDDAQLDALREYLREPVELANGDGYRPAEL